MYASGPFTRITFFLSDGDLLIAVPKCHAVGEKGDLVNTIPSGRNCNFR